MTKNQFERAAELDKEIQKYVNLLSEIRSGFLTKIEKDKKARNGLEERGAEHNDYKAKWTLLRFFSLRFEKKKVIVMPHYEFARGIEMDAEPELIEIILDYLEKKKSECEKEFEQIGDMTHDRAENETD